MLCQIVINAKEREILIQGNKIALGVSETLVRTAREGLTEKVIFE